MAFKSSLSQHVHICTITGGDHDSTTEFNVMETAISPSGYVIYETLGAVSIRKTVLPGMAIPMLKIRRPNGRLIFNMEIATRR